LRSVPPGVLGADLGPLALGAVRVLDPHLHADVGDRRVVGLGDADVGELVHVGPVTVSAGAVSATPLTGSVVPSCTSAAGAGSSTEPRFTSSADVGTGSGSGAGAAQTGRTRIVPVKERKATRPADKRRTRCPPEAAACAAANSRRDLLPRGTSAGSTPTLSRRSD
jgi:hypothetical protein